MELWIRSQDRKIFQKVNKLYVATFSEEQGFGIYDLRYDDLEDIDDTDVPLGFYKSKERALEVLDEIQDLIKPKIVLTKMGEVLGETCDGIVYSKPNEYDIKELSTILYEMPID